MTTQHGERSPRTERFDAPTPSDVDFDPTNTSEQHHEKARHRALKVLSAAGALAIGLVGFVTLEGGDKHSAQTRPPQATGKPFETPSTSSTAASEAPSHAADLPSSILVGQPYRELDAKTQADLTRLSAETVDDFEKEPRGERILFEEVFHATYGDATEKALKPYDEGGDKTRLIPQVELDPTKNGQAVLTTFSERFDESLISLATNGNPDTLTTDAARRAQAIKAAAGLVFSTDTITYGNPYPSMKATIQDATSFNPSKATETNQTAPDIAYRESPWLKDGANGNDFIVIDNEPYPTTPVLQYNFVKEKGIDNKTHPLIVSIMNESDNQFEVHKAPTINPDTGIADSTSGW